MKTYTIPKKSLTLWRIRVIMLTIVLLCVFFAIPMPKLVFIILASVILFLNLLANFWYLPQFMKSCRITVFDGKVVITRGVLIENTHIMPFSRLIHSQTVQTPLARLFGLSILFLKAARFRLFIIDMSDEDITSLIDELGVGGN
ncbi:MAG: PH domain-containing protein [Clostridia bacterium]|nr:PH domain-containing protein [Clostridia bacterium]